MSTGKAHGPTSDPAAVVQHAPPRPRKPHSPGKPLLSNSKISVSTASESSLQMAQRGQELGTPTWDAADRHRHREGGYISPRPAAWPAAGSRIT